MAFRLTVLLWLLLAFVSVNEELCAQLPQFKNLRFDDRYWEARADSSFRVAWPYKFIGTDKFPNFNLALGGEVRQQVQWLRHEDWGLGTPGFFAAWYSRVLLHSEWRLGQPVRLFVQWNHTAAFGRPQGNRSIDQNLMALHQVFFELKHKKYLLRVGRQEIKYGSQRIVSVREGPNNRLSFDGFVLRRDTKQASSDAFALSGVQINQGVLDDRIQNGETLWGFYHQRKRPNLLHKWELYYIGFSSSLRQYNESNGQEMRHSIGVRCFGENHTWKWDAEALWQWGRFANRNIRAYTVSLHTQYTPSRWSDFSLGWKSEIISGDHNSNDGMLNTFNALYPRGAYFGLVALIGPANLIDLHPSIEWQLSKSWKLSADYDRFWRHSTRDAIYGPNTLPVVADGGDAPFIGDQLSIHAEWESPPHWSIVPELAHFLPGPALREAKADKSVFFTAITAQFKF